MRAAIARQVRRLLAMRGVKRLHYRLVEILLDQLRRNAPTQEIRPQEFGIGRVDLGIAPCAPHLAGERAIGIVGQLADRPRHVLTGAAGGLTWRSVTRSN